MVVDELPRLGVSPLNFPREFGSPERNDPIVLRYKGKKANINEDWGFRDYNQTVRNWGGKDKAKDAAVLAQLEYDRDRRPDKETPKIRGLAVPGASQHLAMIAFDLNRATCANTEVIQLLQKNGWWRTIRDDNCHFTYLGWKDTKSLLANGLMKVTCRRKEGPVGRRVEIARDFWVPNLEEFTFIWYTGWLCEGDTLIPNGND